MVIRAMLEAPDRLVHGVGQVHEDQLVIRDGQDGRDLVATLAILVLLDLQENVVSKVYKGLLGRQVLMALEEFRVLVVFLEKEDIMDHPDF